MSTNAIISTRNFDINRISFVVGQPKNGRNPSINIKYDGQNLSLRLPRLGFPGGVLVREDDKTGTTSYTLIGSLKGCDSYAKERGNDADDVGKFYNILLDLEERIVQAAVENSMKWFGRKRSEEAIRDGFKHLMRLSVDKIDGEYVPNGKYPPSVTLKIPVYDGRRVNMEIIDSRGNPVYTSPATLQGTFSKGMEANLVTTASIYVMAGGGFGVTWRVSHAQVFQQSRVTAASIFSDSITNEQAPVVADEYKEQSMESPPLNVEIPDSLEETSAPPPPTAAARRRRAVPATPA